VNHVSEVNVMRWIAGIVALAVGVAAGCNGNFMFLAPAIPGSGVAKDETRAVDAFHAVDAGNALQVTVAITPGAKPGLKLSGDDNLVPLVESVVTQGTLILRIKDNSNISPKLPLLLEVVTDKLDGIEASGAASIKVKGDSGTKIERFTASASGAATISVEEIDVSQAVASASGASGLVLSGSASSMKVEASGASSVKAQGLKAEDADVSISGASAVALSASRSVAGDVSGASQLNLHGHPKKNNVSTAGASSVNESP
jgi:hypothetical protein